jgi:hypothetical protein
VTIVTAVQLWESRIELHHSLMPVVPVLRGGGTLSKNSIKSSASAAADPPPKPANLINSRRWPRHRLDIPIRVIVQTPERTKLYDGRGNELNEGGMAVTAGVELEVGREVSVEFTPAYTGVPIRVRGVVRNRTGYRYGVEFATKNGEELDQVTRLRSLLQTLSTIARE